MNNWLTLIQKRVGDTKYPTLKRIRAGKFILGIAALPLGTSVLFPVAAVLMIPIKPSLWAKDKIRHLNEWRKLR